MTHHEICSPTATFQLPRTIAWITGQRTNFNGHPYQPSIGRVTENKRRSERHHARYRQQISEFCVRSHLYIRRCLIPIWKFNLFMPSDSQWNFEKPAIFPLSPLWLPHLVFHPKFLETIFRIVDNFYCVTFVSMARNYIEKLAQVFDLLLKFTLSLMFKNNKQKKLKQYKQIKISSNQTVNNTISEVQIIW